MRLARPTSRTASGALLTAAAEASTERVGSASGSCFGTAALTSVEAYEELVHKQGWSHDRYEKWLAAALRHALLGED